MPDGCSAGGKVSLSSGRKEGSPAEPHSWVGQQWESLPGATCPGKGQQASLYLWVASSSHTTHTRQPTFVDAGGYFWDRPYTSHNTFCEGLIILPPRGLIPVVCTVAFWVCLSLLVFYADFSLNYLYQYFPSCLTLMFSTLNQTHLSPKERERVRKVHRSEEGDKKLPRLPVSATLHTVSVSFSHLVFAPD